MINRLSKQDTSLLFFSLITLLICTNYCIFFRPVVAGDSNAYILLAKQLYNLPIDNIEDLSHRSPLYSLILGGFILVFKGSTYLKLVLVFQYLLLGISGLIVYKISFVLSGSNKLSFLSGSLSLLNISTIYFSYSILSETVALFLLTTTAYLIILFNKKGSNKYIFLAGISSGLLVLTRFNAIGLPLVLIFIIISIHLIINGISKLNKLVRTAILFLLPVILVLNLWAFYNLSHRGYYNLFPKQHYGQRWAIPASINKNNKVTYKFADVLKIFIEEKEKLIKEQEKDTLRNGSLLNIKIISNLKDHLQPEVNGYFLYSNAEPRLLKYYNLEYNSASIELLGEKIRPFYREIAQENKYQLLKYRIYSLISTFRVCAAATDIYINSGNLSLIPVSVLIAYKLGFMVFMILVYLTSAFYLLNKFLKKRLKENIDVFIITALIWYFPVINFYANVLGDANRFKVPAESLIITMGVYLLWRFYNKKLNPGEHIPRLFQ